MRQIMLKTLAVGVTALGLIAFGGSAPAIDEETLAVEEDLRPDEVPEDMKDEGDPNAPRPEPSAGESGGGNIEDEMIDKIGPGAE